MIQYIGSLCAAISGPALDHSTYQRFSGSTLPCYRTERCIDTSGNVIPTPVSWSRDQIFLSNHRVITVAEGSVCIHVDQQIDEVILPAIIWPVNDKKQINNHHGSLCVQTLKFVMIWFCFHFDLIWVLSSWQFQYFADFKFVLKKSWNFYFFTYC